MSSLVDSRRTSSTHATRSQQLIPSILGQNTKILIVHTHTCCFILMSRKVIRTINIIILRATSKNRYVYTWSIWAEKRCILKRSEKTQATEQKNSEAHATSGILPWKITNIYGFEPEWTAVYSARAASKLEMWTAVLFSWGFMHHGLLREPADGNQASFFHHGLCALRVLLLPHPPPPVASFGASPPFSRNHSLGTKLFCHTN